MLTIPSCLKGADIDVVTDFLESPHLRCMEASWFVQQHLESSGYESVAVDFRADRDLHNGFEGSHTVIKYWYGYEERIVDLTYGQFDSSKDVIDEPLEVYSERFPGEECSELEMPLDHYY